MDFKLYLVINIIIFNFNILSLNLTFLELKKIIFIESIYFKVKF